MNNVNDSLGSRGRDGTGRRPGRRAAFTLIELLVAISIIALLATLTVGGINRATRATKESRVRAEMAQLVTAIESYKEKLGSHPLDNATNAAINPLFYELMGVVVDRNAGAFRTKDKAEGITSAKVKEYFGLDGFANAAENAAQVQRFFAPRATQYAEVSRPPDDVEVLIAPIPWPSKARASAPVQTPGKESLNPWRYLAPGHATNNPGSFDLWVDYVDGREVKRIGNWARDPVVVGRLRPDGQVDWQ